MAFADLVARMAIELEQGNKTELRGEVGYMKKGLDMIILYLNGTEFENKTENFETLEVRVMWRFGKLEGLYFKRFLQDFYEK